MNRQTSQAQDGGAPVAELDGDELGYLVARVAGFKRWL